MPYRLVPVALLLCAVAAPPAQAQKPKRERNVIGSEEITKAQVNNAMQVVERLRPEFLRRERGPVTLNNAATRPGQGQNATRPGGAAGEDGNPVANAAGPDTKLFDPPSMAGQVVVYIGANEMGGADELERIPAEQIDEIRFFGTADAEAKYGTGKSGGVILVTLKGPR